jgi:phosphohistidine swiveling domain-containing protein
MLYPSADNPFIQTYQETEIISPFFGIPLVNTNFGLLKYNLPTYSYLGLQYTNDYLYPLMLEAESFQVSSAVFNRIDKNRDFVLNTLEPDILHHKEKLETIILEIENLDISNLDQAFVFDLYSRLQTTLTEYWSLVWVSVAIDFPNPTFSDFIQKLLQDDGAIQAQSVELITLFQNVSAQDLALGQYFKKLLKLNKMNESPKIEDLKEFEWIHWNYDNGELLNRDLIHADLTEAKKWNFIDLETERKKVLEKIENTEIKFWLKTLSGLSRIKAQNKEMLSKVCFCSQKLIEEMSFALKLDKNDLKWMTVLEIDNFIKHNLKINQTELNLRRKQGFYIIHNNQIKVFSEDNQIKVKTTKTDLNTCISGQIACGGKATGKVVIIKGTEEMKYKEFPQNSILVSVSTNPNMLPIMRKASAIVTEVGGITSHASIVSRELGIPCIVGTKIATQVLHDGDLVEVDAQNGIVTVIIN